MKRLFVAMMLLPLLAQGQTLEECQQAAERNYPLISQYGLIEKTTDLTMSNLSKGWLPQVTASAQATYQSDVVAWPDQMQTIYQQMGLDMKGLKKDQYKVGIDVQQMVFDGGAISSQRDIAREQGRVQEAQTEVTMYQVRRRVNEMYFGLLMLDEQIALNNDLQSLLAANEQKLSSMWKRGTASESDYQAVKAERLNVMQQATTLDAQRRAVMRMLSTFCGMEVTHVEKPALIALPSQDVAQRPELKAIDAQLSLANAQERLLNAALRPRLSLFASGFYGYPGYNMFDDMMSHDWSWNGMVGARLSWNLGAFYTHRNDKAKIRLQRDMAETSREVFLFNNRLELIQQNENIEQYRRLMNDDEEIIALRSSVRKAAESKLAHGIIDVNDLVKEINAENAARVQQSMHEIKLLKEVYDMKFTTNN
ncbi:MAG: TolC family protein [Bacteroidales bacterium]|nr:TolC family protein [Bacteroidales bacterium]